ncbi:MAG: SUMF1/EgtB/PvdO family nonheme iron enzyme, partial [Fibrobacteres bacterium]|nr:SUMF1/EgtB/PvdO family nonheme iron enzyme [Fibrobacterota bacterium]
GYTLLNYNGSSDSAWNIVYFASRPADSILKKYPSILMPSPCTVTVRDNPIPVLVWNTDTNGVVRLPTAFEWEQAAICGSHSLLYSTNTGRLNMESAVYGKSASMETEGNSARAANPYGLVDMTGNLYEWVDTWVYKPYKGLKGGYYGSAAGDSTLLNLFTASGIPDSTYSGKTGFRPIIVGSPSVDSLLNMLKK